MIAIATGSLLAALLTFTSGRSEDTQAPVAEEGVALVKASLDELEQQRRRLEIAKEQLRQIEARNPYPVPYTAAPQLAKPSSPPSEVVEVGRRDADSKIEEEKKNLMIARQQLDRDDEAKRQSEIQRIESEQVKNASVLRSIQETEALRAEAIKLAEQSKEQQKSAVEKEKELSDKQRELSLRVATLELEKAKVERQQQLMEVRDTTYSLSLIALVTSTLVAIIGLVWTRRKAIVDIRKVELEISAMQRK